MNITFFEYVNTPTAIASPPKRKSCSFEEKTNMFKMLASVKGEIGTKTPMTFAILLAPKLYAPKAPAIIKADLVYASIRRMCNLIVYCIELEIILLIMELKEEKELLALRDRELHIQMQMLLVPIEYLVMISMNMILFVKQMVTLMEQLLVK